MDFPLPQILSAASRASTAIPSSTTLHPREPVLLAPMRENKLSVTEPPVPLVMRDRYLFSLSNPVSLRNWRISGVIVPSLNKRVTFIFFGCLHPSFLPTFYLGLPLRALSKEMLSGLSPPDPHWSESTFFNLSFMNDAVRACPVSSW